ncbi:hypothetical protein Clacol_000404 [Clathrus columnatus]|uniref:Laccase n=1 Tax=Clathrus columnatus TaxID=1419009 RepID=A0AAV4ZYZ8_9AGAM|nr:hypothetical protein Clacol_000404 [Clathrus columnatus]
MDSNSYTYLVDPGEQAGTFWYHSHLSTQYIDGLRGPLIVYGNMIIPLGVSILSFATDPHDPHKHLYDVDDASTVITLTDWYQQYSEQLAGGLSENPADWMANIITEPVPDSVLFNGIGRYRDGPEVERAVITVEKVIEVDGVNHIPLTATSLSISAGQRYSIVLHADQKVDNYWIAFPTMFLGNVTTAANPNYNGSEAYAVLHYKGAPHDEPQSSQLIPQVAGVLGFMGALQEYQLTPLEHAHPPGGSHPDITIKLNFTTTKHGDSSTLGAGNYWIINGERVTFLLLYKDLEIC